MYNRKTAIRDGSLEKGIVLAIATSEGLSHLRWELLHDGKNLNSLKVKK
ncbi:MAG: hypothetical protein MGG11_11830 [Trichodesmium sp. MAG_R03]|nr:hypothetical protein [Trichodesmium sp. MAG_R03]